ncbi:MAG: TerB family tellurite resistance protein [Pelagibacteraceae bacterium]
MNKNLLKKKDLTGIAALLINIAKIDEHYTEVEKKIINNFIKKFTNKSEEVNEIFTDAEKIEKNSIQLLDFTNIIKKNSIEFKSLVIKELWQIILSDSNADDFEVSMMRKICGLIYFPDKLNGEIKLQVLKELKL